MQPSIETATAADLERLSELQGASGRDAATRAAEAIQAAPTSETGIVLPPHVAAQVEQEQTLRRIARVGEHERLVHLHVGSNRAQRRAAAKRNRS